MSVDFIFLRATKGDGEVKRIADGLNKHTLALTLYGRDKKPNPIVVDLRSYYVLKMWDAYINSASI